MYQGIGNTFVDWMGKNLENLVSTWRSVHLDKAENMFENIQTGDFLLPQV